MYMKCAHACTGWHSSFCQPLCLLYSLFLSLKARPLSVTVPHAQRKATQETLSGQGLSLSSAAAFPRSRTLLGWRESWRALLMAQRPERTVLVRRRLVADFEVNAAGFAWSARSPAWEPDRF